MRIGILGGGQLGRMIIEAGQPLGNLFHVYDPGPAEPCQIFQPTHYRKEFDDFEALKNFGEACDQITLEFENVPCETTEFLSKITPVRPATNILKITQNRFFEKSLAKETGIGVADFLLPESTDQASRFFKKHGKILLKTNREGYDGKGQQVCSIEKEVHDFMKTQGANNEILAEQFIPFRKEFSVICARNTAGEIVFMPIAENVHYRGILVYSFAPAKITETEANRACEYAKKIAEKLDLTGLLAIEFFLSENGEVLLNEMAPRPHNSGHYSMDACDISQFLLINQLLTGKPLKPPKLKKPVVMINILGEFIESFRQKASLSSLPENFHFHFYDKSEAKPQRKMGHLNVTGNSLEEIQNKIRQHGLDFYPGLALT